jgi:hypothetical protein
LQPLHEGQSRVPVINPETIAQAAAQLAQAEAARAMAETERKRLFGLRAQAETWLGLLDRRERACAKRKHFRQLIRDSERIARDWARLQELETVLPAVRESIDRRASRARSEAQLHHGEDRHRAASRKLDVIARLAEDNRSYLERILEEMERDRARDRAILERQAALTIPMHRTRQARSKSEEVHQLAGVLASYPTDLAARVADLEKELRRRAEWKAAVPSLATLARERGRLAEARHLLKETEDDLNVLERQIAALPEEARRDPQEFAEAFRDGYHFEVVDGSTRARPFHR